MISLILDNLNIKKIIKSRILYIYLFLSVKVRIIISWIIIMVIRVVVLLHWEVRLMHWGVWLFKMTRTIQNDASSHREALYPRPGERNQSWQ